LATQPSANFACLAYHDARLVALATQAEQHFKDDPTVIRALANVKHLEHLSDSVLNDYEESASA
jgi:hypothetical protein